jgi:hypothetical protein
MFQKYDFKNILWVEQLGECLLDINLFRWMPNFYHSLITVITNDFDFEGTAIKKFRFGDTKFIWYDVPKKELFTANSIFLETFVEWIRKAEKKRILFQLMFFSLNKMPSVRLKNFSLGFDFRLVRNLFLRDSILSGLYLLSYHLLLVYACLNSDLHHLWH